MNNKANMISDGNSKPVFYIHSPVYTDFSSGVKALYILCDRLNNNGYEAYITGQNGNGNLWAPTLTPSIIESHRACGRFLIAIYPEVEMGNPLLIPNVVRYMLNQPNFFFVNWFGSFYKDEYILHYAEEFTVPWVKSEPLRIQTIDRNIFKLPQHGWEERSGFLVYSHRVKNPPLEELPEWCKPFKVISMEEPVAAKDLAEMYKRSCGLILFERSAAIPEAILCGCPVILVPGDALTEMPKALNESGSLGVAWGLDLEQYGHAVKTVGLNSKFYDSEDILDLYRFKSIIDKMIGHFMQKHNDSKINTSIIMELANKEYKAGLYSNAINRYNIVINEGDNDIEAYYRISLAMIKNNMIDHALQMLQLGEKKLTAMPEHKALKSARALFYVMLVRIVKPINDSELIKKYGILMDNYYDPDNLRLKNDTGLQL
jgi:hypothetical protein